MPLLLFAVCFITLREEVTSEIAADAAPIIQISSKPNQRTDWIEFVGSPTVPPLLAQGNRLIDLREFRNPWANKATVWLSTSARFKAISFDPQKAEGLRSLRFGTIEWRIGWPPPWAKPMADVVFLGKPGIDITGPSGVPDGEPDLVLQVTL